MPRDEAAGIEVPEAMLRRVHALYVGGMVIDALDLAKTAGPLERWTGTEARILAGRLAGNLGGMRLALLHHIRAWQADPAHPKALYYYARTLMDRKGPLEAWRFILKMGMPKGASNKGQADWLSLEATVAATLRDFGTAEGLIARAIELAPDRAWIWIERGYVLQAQDRLEEALESVKKSLELRPLYRPGIQQAAQILSTLNRDAEALDLLERAAERSQSAAVHSQLAVMLLEMEQKDRARGLWEKVVELSPLADKTFKKFLAARRSDAAYEAGDFAAAATLAKEVGPGFYEKIAERLSADLTGKERVELEVPFVRQHHMTCAPATLAAISRFWEMPAEHLEIVESICYDGTPAHSERSWAEGAGYMCREFRVTWDSAVALIDRGAPFTLTTTETTSAHLQAVIGYDARKHTLILRDPSFKLSNEILAEGLEERYKSTGPRGMVLIPREKAHLLEGIELPEAGLYDLFHEVQRGLVKHRRADAAAAYGKMVALEAQSRLTQWAKRSIGSYDADHATQLSATEALMKMYPDDPLLKLSKLGMLRHMARRAELLETLREASTADKADPIFLVQYAQELIADPGEGARAEKMLRKYVRYRPGDCGGYYVLGNLLWGKRRFDEAMDLYRFAACLNDKDDQLASMFFGAARHFRKADEAIALLKDRFARFGGRSGTPARTLYRALAAVDRTHEAFEAIEAGMRRRAEDADLTLYAADLYARHGNTQRAMELLAKVDGKVHASVYLRARSTVAAYQGELKTALAYWQKVLEAEPLAQDAHENVAHLLGETQGREAALNHLRGACARFEHHYPMHQLLMAWLGGENVAEHEAMVRRLLEARPADAWLLRELALVLIRQGRALEALGPAEEALRLDPNNTSSQAVAGRVYAFAAMPEKAKTAFEEAIRLSVDNDAAMSALLELCVTITERREALAFICAELVKQVTFGEGLVAFRILANQTLEGEETLRTLTEALEHRPDLWHAWAAKSRQLAEMGRLEEAKQIAQQAVERFPLLPKLWLDLARLQGLVSEWDEQETSLRQALQIAPGWGAAVRQLAESRTRRGDFADAKKLLEGAIAWSPMDAINYAFLGESLWKLGEKDSAIEQMKTALRLSPGYDWGWSTLRQWGAELERKGIAGELAREMTIRRAGEAQSWYTLARMLDEEGAMEERLAAMEKAIQIEPLSVDFHDYRAYLLARAGKLEEAEKACRPEVFEEMPPRLKGRAAWIDAVRGDVPAAIEKMNQVVNEDPRSSWGWTLLAEWTRDLARDAEYLRAAEAMTALAPLESTSWGYLAEARERMKDNPGALEAYRRAFDLDPANTFAAFGLFDLQLEARNFDEAACIIEEAAKHERGPYLEARRVQLGCRMRDSGRAGAAVARLCATDALPRGPLWAACDEMDKVGWKREAQGLLWDALAAGGHRIAVARKWTQYHADARAWGMIEDGIAYLRSIAPEAGQMMVENCREVALAYIELLGVHLEKTRLDRYVRMNRQWLEADVKCWGTVGAGLLDCYAHRQMLEWMQGWRSREGVGQWMISNVVESHFALGGFAEARNIATAGLNYPKDHCQESLILFLTLDEAASGAVDSAWARVKPLVRDDQPKLRQFIIDVVTAQCATAREPGLTAAQAYAKAKAELEAIARIHKDFRKHATMRQALGQAVKSIARRRGTIAARWWAVRWGIWIGMGRNEKTK